MYYHNHQNAQLCKHIHANSLSNYTDAINKEITAVSLLAKKVNMFTLSGFSATLLLHQPITIIITRSTSTFPILVN